VVALDRFMAERINRKVNVDQKMLVAPPWPHEDHVEPIAHEDNPFRAEQQLNDKVVVMYSGNLSLASPVTTIVEAARRVEDLKDLLFLFVGGGMGKKEIDELIARESPPNIRSLPYQPIEKLRFSLSAADVHFVSVGNDVVGICHPCKIYGSMAVSRPILCLGPRPSHATDIIDGENIGWTVEHGDVDRAESLIREIYRTSRETRMEMGRRAREIVDLRFTKSRLCGEFCDVVEHGPTKQTKHAT
jgi:glycosyltransferase involved in cell wall biosynthesis